MSEDRLQVRLLAAEWAEELGINQMTPAKALVEAALSGEFETLPPGERITVFDDTLLIYTPIMPQSSRGAKLHIEIAIRAGFAHIHKSAALRFANNDCRDYPPPKRWAVKAGDLTASAIYKLHKEEIIYILRLEKRPKTAVLSKVKEALANRYSKKAFEDAWRDTASDHKLARGEKSSS